MTRPSLTRRCALLLIGTTVFITSCGGPTTLQEVCSEYRELNDEINSDALPGLFDGHIFRQIESLGDTASRYESGGSIASAGDRLSELADRNSLSVNEIYSAAGPINASC